MSTNYREIVTKAVVAKGECEQEASHLIRPSEKPSSILGCWIINHRYEAVHKGPRVELRGSYDVNIWYSHEYNTRTEVCTETVDYVDELHLSIGEDHFYQDDEHVIAQAIKVPNCLDCLIQEDGETIEVKVERAFAAQLIAETKLRVVHYESE